MRIGRETVDAEHRGLLTQLIDQSAVVPWDARAAVNATVDDLSETLVREHLRVSGSGLVEAPDARTIYRMDIVRVNDHEAPRNVGLLLFSRDPARWFPGARIETSILRAGAGGDVLEEKDFRRGLAEQVRACLGYLRSEVGGSTIHKAANGVRASRRPSYPEEALREVLVNALYHRGYDEASPHTTLVRITSNRIDIRSTPGPVPGVGRDELVRGATPKLVPLRNPRIGELLKEIGLAEKRLTGLDKVHEALDTLETAWRANRGSLVLAEEFVRQCVALGDLDRAEPVVGTNLHLATDIERPDVVVPWLEALIADGQRDRAHRTLVERLLGMDAPRRRHAWAWRELGRIRRWLREPESAVNEAYANAIRLAPDEERFREER